MMKIHTALFVILMLIAAMKMDNIQEQQGTLSHELSQAPVKHELSYIDQDQVIPKIFRGEASAESQNAKYVYRKKVFKNEAKEKSKIRNDE